MIRLKRVYEEPQPDDGFRVLVERLWPRGLTKSEAHLDLWLKEIAPSPELRKWFNHDPARWDEFTRRYTRELENNTTAVGLLRKEIRDHRNVTFLYAARDTEHNSALLLKKFLTGRK